MSKDYGRSQGVVSGGAPVPGGYDRQIFFPLTPEIIEFIEEHGIDNLYAQSIGVDVDIEKYLPLLPDVEAEIFFMIHIKQKMQKDVAQLLGMPQSTVSYRYRRAMDKLQYLLVLAPVPLKDLIGTIPGLNEKERTVLEKLFYKANQEMVGSELGVRQSSVKWIFTKAKRYIAEKERPEPEGWFRQYALFLLLERNLRKRIFC